MDGAVAEFEFADGFQAALVGVLGVIQPANKRAEFCAAKKSGERFLCVLRGGIGGDGVVPLSVCLADGEAVEQRAEGVDFNLVLVGVADLDGLGGDLDGERHGGIIPLWVGF